MVETRVALPWVRWRNGRAYFQPTPAVRALGFQAEALGGDPVKVVQRAAELRDAIEAARQGREVEPVQDRTVSALIRSYRRSPAYIELADASKTAYEWYLDRIERVAGKLKVSSLSRGGMVKTYEKLRDNHSLHIANGHMALWYVLFRHALDLGWRKDDPMHKFRLLKPESRTQLWSREAIDRLCAAAVKLERPSVALAVRLGYDTAQRPADVLRLPWTAYDGDSVLLRQSKTGALIKVPLSPETIALLEDAPRRAPLIVINENGDRAYTKETFGYHFRAARKAAGIPSDMQFRDFRRTAATELGQAGATDDEIRSVTGHRSREMVSVYVLPTGEMASNAQAKRWKSERERNGKV